MLRDLNATFTKCTPSLNRRPVIRAASSRLSLAELLCCHSVMSNPLAEALRRFRRSPDAGGEVPARVSAAEFRAAAEQRLRALEREVAEVKGRVNGLIFVVAGAVITQVVLRLVG